MWRIRFEAEFGYLVWPERKRLKAPFDNSLNLIEEMLLVKVNKSAMRCCQSKIDTTRDRQRHIESIGTQISIEIFDSKLKGEYELRAHRNRLSNTE